jgi:hypothetical protein
MNDTACRRMMWIVTSATASMGIGIGLNLVVGQTLGSFSVASVLLALYVAFWAFALGSVALIAVTIWVLLTRKPLLPTVPCAVTAFRMAMLRASPEQAQ